MKNRWTDLELTSSIGFNKPERWSCSATVAGFARICSQEPAEAPAPAALPTVGTVAAAPVDGSVAVWMLLRGVRWICGASVGAVGVGAVCRCGVWGTRTGCADGDAAERLLAGHVLQAKIVENNLIVKKSLWVYINESVGSPSWHDSVMNSAFPVHSPVIIKEYKIM